MKEILRSVLLLMVLLNPFLIIVYLRDIIKKKSRKIFLFILLRAALISITVFGIFAILGDEAFRRYLNADFASFQIFGGVVFLLIGLQFIFKGGSAIESLRGESKHVAGAIAMPIFIGPGTISYAIIIGKRLSKMEAVISIAVTVILCISIIYLLKVIFDAIHKKKEDLLEQYYEIAGRVTAIILGTISIEMIMQGLSVWLQKF